MNVFAHSCSLSAACYYEIGTSFDFIIRFFFENHFHGETIDIPSISLYHTQTTLSYIDFFHLFLFAQFVCKRLLF